MADDSRERASNLPGPGDTSARRVGPRNDFEAEVDDIAFDPAPHWALMVRRKWLLLGVLVSMLLVTAANLVTTTPLYTSTATIQIHADDPNVLPYEEVLNSASSSIARRGEDVQTQAKKLKTRSLARRVIERLELTDDAVFNQPRKRGFIVDWPLAVIRTLRGASTGPPVEDDQLGDALAKQVDSFVERVIVAELRNTRLIEVSYESVSPERAALIVNVLAEEFIESNLGSKFDATRKATDFLQKELQDLQLRVEESEEESLQYARSKSIVSLGERETIARKKLADLSDDVTESQITLIEKKVRYEALVDAAPGEFPENLGGERMRAFANRLSGAEEEYEVLSDRFGPEWPASRELRQKIQALTRQIEIERDRIVKGAQQEYETALLHHQSLSAGLERQTAIVDRINEDLIQYNIIRREVDTNKLIYEGLLQRLKEAGISGGLRSSNISIADEGVVPRDPSSPNKTRTIMIAVMLGLLLGGCAALLAENLDNSIKSLDDVKRYLGLPALGFVPRLEPLQDPERSQLQSGKRRAPVIAYNESKRFQSRDWEAYRSLRTSILLSHSGTPPQTLLVTSALPSEGKSTTAANIAIALAQGGARTVLLDLDLRRPQLEKLFGVNNREGMTNYLSGNSPLSGLIQETSYAGLFLLTSGPSAPNPPELLASEKMTKALEQLSKEFTHVIADTPPCFQFTDSIVLSPRMDGVVLIARSGKTPKAILKKLGDRFSSVGATVLGVVLNDLVVHSSEYGYYGYYGNYKHYHEVQPSAPADTDAEQGRVGFQTETAAFEQNGDNRTGGTMSQFPAEPTVVDFTTDGSAAVEPAPASFASSGDGVGKEARHDEALPLGRVAKPARSLRGWLWGFVGSVAIFGGIASVFVFGPAYKDETAAPQPTAGSAAMPIPENPVARQVMDDLDPGMNSTTVDTNKEPVAKDAIGAGPGMTNVHPPAPSVAAPVALTKAPTPPTASQPVESSVAVFEPPTEVFDASTAGEGFAPPRSISRVQPTYNADDVERGETVVLRVLISDWGKAVRVDVEQGRTGSPLVNAAVDAVLNARYYPAEYRGRQVRAWTTETFVFE